MAKLNLFKRVDFFYFIGAIISLNLFFISVIFYKDSGLPMIFSLVCFGAYIGVFIRGLIDPDSWGISVRQLKISAYVGFSSIFLIVFIEFLLLITTSFELSNTEILEYVIYVFIALVILYILLFNIWFKRIRIYKKNDKD